MTTTLNIIFVFGLVAIAIGAGMVALPAGFVVGGLLASGTALTMARGELRGQLPGGSA